MTVYKLDGETLPLDSLPSGDLRQAYDYWCALKGTRAFPSRHDISPEGMRPFLARVLLIDVHHSPLDFVYRVYGSSIVAAGGADFTGKSVRNLVPSEFAELILGQYSVVLRAGDALFHRVRHLSGNRYQNYHRITMPLSTDGSTIDKLLAVSIEHRNFWKIAD